MIEDNKCLLLPISRFKMITCVNEAGRCILLKGRFPCMRCGDDNWKDHIDVCTEVNGDGYLVLVCKSCGYLKRLEDT